MTKKLRREAAAMLVMAAISVAPVTAWAQDVTAEVRTWDGLTFHLDQPTLEVFYTLLPGAREVPGAPAAPGGAEGVSVLPDTGVPAPGGPGYGATTLPGGGVPAPLPSVIGGGYDQPSLSGSMQGLGAYFGRTGKEIITAQGRRQRDSVPLYQGGVETRVPLNSIASLTFVRRPVTVSSGLPPYVAARQFLYGATAELTDGSKVEGDYVSLGTTLLRGATPQGRVDIPWEEIEVVRFTR